LNSKELLEKSGISRATLNNYIGWGIVPKPEVLPPGPRDGAAPRIGYFPDEVVGRIADIQRLKKDGWSMARIAEHFAAGRTAPAPTDEASKAGVPAASAAPAGPATASLSLDEVSQPAYIVDGRFELSWFSSAAHGVLGNPAASPSAGPQNVFKYLLRGSSADTPAREQILRFHLGLAKRHGIGISEVCREVPEADRVLLERLYREAQRAEQMPICQTSVAAGPSPAAQSLTVYAVQVRQGTLFLYAPDTAASRDSPLNERAPVVGDSGRKRLAELSHVAVLVADLQYPVRIWSELPAEEYFQLVNQVWSTVDPIFRRHHGTHGKHAGDGMVCYFFPRQDSSYLWNALAAASEMREAMRRVSKAWQVRKGWTTELYMNAGIDEGQQWLGTLKAAGQVEFTMLGDALNRAARISDLARSGSIWATRNLVGKLAPPERRRLTFGVRRKGADGGEGFVSSVFSTVENLLDLPAPGGEKFKDIARLPITEIVSVAAVEDPRRGPAAGETSL
jgi:adenylate cyclase